MRGGVLESSSPLSTLQRLDLQEVLEDFIAGIPDAGKVYKGRVVAATVSSMEFSERTYIAEICSPDGSFSTGMIVVNGSPGDALPVGTRVAVKEPLLIDEDCPILVVHSPPALGLLENWPLELLMDLQEDPELLRAEGNTFFGSKSYELAVQKYGFCMSKLSITKWRLRIGHRPSSQHVRGCPNRLQQGPQGRSRKGLALMGLQEHEAALKYFEKALELSSDHKRALTEDLEACNKAIEQKVLGKYDLRGYIMGDWRVNGAPPCSDFVGPVEAGLTADGRGRGLFVTRDVRAGELLMVCNPLATSTFDIDGNDRTWECFDLSMAAFRACNVSTRVQVLALADTDGNTPGLMRSFEVNHGIYDEYMLEKPPSVLVDMKTAMEVAKMSFFWNVYYVKSHCGLTAVWGLPTLMNHSCLPNTSRFDVGLAMFIRASRDELLTSYYDPFGIHEAHSKVLKDEHGIVCSCKRCKVVAELQLGRLLSKFRGDFEAAEEAGSTSQLAAAAAALCRQVEFILDSGIE